jgi:hypothetical protein
MMKHARFGKFLNGGTNAKKFALHRVVVNQFYHLPKEKGKEQTNKQIEW